MRWVTQFLMHQINTDFISANCDELEKNFNSLNLLTENNFELENLTISEFDIININSSFQLDTIKIKCFIKRQNQNNNHTKMSKITELINLVEELREYITNNPALQ